MSKHSASELGDLFAFQLRAAGIDGYTREFKFHPSRQWRFDFAWPAERIAVEIDGGQWLAGTAHNSGTGRERDCEKDAEAMLLGWRVLRFTTTLVVDGRALRYTERALNGPGRAKSITEYSDTLVAEKAKT